MGVAVLRDMMEKRYHEIKSLFKRASKTYGYNFNEDIFSEVYIKCFNALQTKNMSEIEITKYLWTAFINNTKKESKKTIYTIDIVEFLENDDVEDITYDETRYKAVDIIIENVKAKFNKAEFDAWYLHFMENKTYEELKILGYDFNFHNVFRNINNFIKIKLPKMNKEFKTIIKERFRKN